MKIRWLRRILWLILLAVLIVAPARLAEAPAPADAAVNTSSSVVETAHVSAPFTGISPTLIIGGTVILLTLAAAIIRGHRVS